MPDIKCPGCGAFGRVPRDKMNTRLVCKKCLRVFHMSPSGKPVLGEPPAQKDAPKERAPRESAGAELAGSFDELASRLGKIKLPQISLRTLGISAGIVLVAALGFWLFMKQSLEQRAMRVAEAIINTDMKTVIDLSVPGTELDTIRWYNDAYRQYLDLKLTLGGIDARVKLKILSDGSSGPAVVVAQLSSEGTRLDWATLAETTQPIPSLSSSKGSLDLTLYMEKDFWGNWILDGKRTAEGKT
jgi:hypothetical protein